MSVHYVRTPKLPSSYVSKGRLRVNVISEFTNIPVQNALVTISCLKEPDYVLKQDYTDHSGYTPIFVFPVPLREYSMIPCEFQPYSQYIVAVTAKGFQPFMIKGTQLFADRTSLQEVRLTPLMSESNIDLSMRHSIDCITIPDNTLYGYYPPKIAESETKASENPKETVLRQVIIPEHIVVHDGPPTDTYAQNHSVLYKDYIKNTASCELYPTWPESALRANILAIMSFTLNRVYTDWYKNQGYEFTLTSSTAFDQKYVYGGNIYENISVIVEELFENYLSRPNVKQPILAQRCDGKKTSCPNWMNKWESSYLGEQHYSELEILQYYYGDNLYMNFAEEIYCK